LRSTDEALKLFNLIDHSFDGLGDAHAPDAPHIHRYALQRLFGKPTNSESWYIGLEIEGGVTRIWGFPGEPSHMMELTPEARFNPIIGDASYHQDDRNKPQLCYGLIYPARTMHSFLFGRLPPLEGVELHDGKGNGSAQENIIPYSPYYYWGEGMQSIRENWTCKIELNKPDDIVFTITERHESSPWNEIGETKWLAGRYRLLLLQEQQNGDGSCSTRPTKDNKKLWQLSRVA
jgi:hypothetical protein